MTQARTTVFVYGTLKRGGTLHHHLAGESFCGEATTQPGYRMFNLGWYPGIVEDPSGGCVRGEVWQVSDECLAVLDDVEEVDSGLYERRFIRLTAPFETDAVEAWFYAGDVSQFDPCGECW